MSETKIVECDRCGITAPAEDLKSPLFLQVPSPGYPDGIVLPKNWMTVKLFGRHSMQQPRILCIGCTAALWQFLSKQPSADKLS